MSVEVLACERIHVESLMMRMPMGLEEPLRDLPHSLQVFLAAERFYLHDIASYQDTSQDPAFDARYLPQNCGAFRLPCFWIRRKHFYVYGHQAETGQAFCAAGMDAADERVLFPIHPTSLPGYRQFLIDTRAEDAAADGLLLWAVPTSSVRTLLTWPDGCPQDAAFCKTTLYSPVFGDRVLSRRTVARSVGLCRLVDRSRPSLPETFRYFAEPAGLAPRSPQVGGAILRCVPGEIQNGRVTAVPMFSLFGGTDEREPMLSRVLDACGLDAMQFVEEVVCAPFASLWVALTFQLGLLLESHAQDLLLALTPTLLPLHGFYYRDFEGMQVDSSLRDQRGVRMQESMPNDWQWEDTYASYGYRYSQLMSYKLHASFFNFVDWVMCPLLDVVRKRQQGRPLSGGLSIEDEAIELFVRHVRNAIANSFGISLRCDRETLRSKNRVVLALLECRKELLHSSGSRGTQSYLGIGRLHGLAS